MLIGGKVYLLTTLLYFVILLSLVYSSLKKLFSKVISNLRNNEKENDNNVKDIVHYIESTQIYTPKYSYKRTDLKIEIPECQEASNDQGDLMLYYFKQNCFPLLLAHQNVLKLKIQQVSIWFLTVCSEIVVCAFINSVPNSFNGKVDFYILGPIVSCFAGLCFAGFFCLIFAGFGSDRYFFLIESGKYLVLIGFWAGGFYASLVFEVRFR